MHSPSKIQSLEKEREREKEVDPGAVQCAVFGLLRLRAAGSTTEESDVALGDLQRCLQAEFTRLGSVGEGAGGSDGVVVKTVLCHLKQAMAYVKHSKVELAREKMMEVDRKALEAFLLATSLEGKVLATRFRLIATLFLSGYFTEEMSTAVIHDQVSIIFDDFLQLKDTRDAVAYLFEPNLRNYIGIGIERSEDVLNAVGAIRDMLLETVAGPTLPIVDSEGEPVELVRATAASLLGHRYRVQSIVLGGNDRLFSTAWDGVRMWDTTTLQKIASGADDGTDRVHCLAFWNERLYGGTKDGSIIIWDARAPVGGRMVEIARVKKHTRNIRSLAVTQSRLYSGSEDSHIRVWNLTNGAPVEIGSLQAHRATVCCLVVGDDRLYSGYDDKTIIVWNTVTLTKFCQLDGHEGGVKSLALSTDGLNLYSGSDDKTIRVWDTNTLTEVDRLNGDNNSGITSLAVGHNGRLYSASNSWLIRVWDTAAVPMKEVSCLHGHRGGVTTLVYDFQGRIFSGSCDKTIRLRWTAVPEEDEELPDDIDFCLSPSEQASDQEDGSD